MKKILTLIIIVLALGWVVALDYVAERTVDTTLTLIEDDIHTDWVKAAKECEVADTIAIADTIKTVDGDAVR